MDYLKPFTDEQRDLIIKLPYRVGLWVSLCDQAGGQEAEQAERQMLESLLTGFAEDCCKSEIVESVLQGTLERKEKWHEWQAGLDQVCQECDRAIGVMSLHISAREIFFFKSSLMDIALNVALAYREMDPEGSFFYRVSLFFRYYMDRTLAVVRHRPVRTFDEYLSISREEREALDKLSIVLNINLGMDAAA
ncbi:MAG: hypothetical protein H6868_09585 [Rhodospirillales bacterium]|nr:hypothetical protein [Rhodospirillales bacterium]